MFLKFFRKMGEIFNVDMYVINWIRIRLMILWKEFKKDIKFLMGY